jgi:hypothetical protein
VSSGLISSAVEQEVLGELRRRGIVVWLDATGAYSTLVDELSARRKEGTFPFDVVAFRGSFLELVLALEPYGNGLDNSPLLVHMPGFTEETIRKTPLLELYEPGYRFRKALDTLVREVAAGRVAPESLEQFLGRGAFTLEEADTWLSAQLSTTREGLAALLDTLGLDVILGSTVGELRRAKTFLGERVCTQPEQEVLEAWLGRQTGMDAAWLAFYSRRAEAEPGAPVPLLPLTELLGAWMAWLLCTEYVHDLGRLPLLPELARLRSLSPPLLKVCQGLVGQLREKHADDYVALADDIETHLQQELPVISPEDLGKVDTFRTEEVRVLDAAVKALANREWAKVRAWADARGEDKSFWLKRDPVRRRAWVLVREAADLAVILSEHARPLDGVRTLDAAVEKYAASAYLVDRAHRRFEQRQTTLLDSQVPHFGDLKEIVRTLRASHRAWADQLSRDFAGICSRVGFLPDGALQQRNLFEQVVLPLAADERVAYFLIDALRYEMATELVEDLKAPGVVVDLKARLAELPSITAVGMNLLAPVTKGGRLEVAGDFDGFRTGEFTVRNPQDRARAIGGRTAGKQSLLLQLAEVCDLDVEKLKKKLASARVIVVHSKEIDDAGEANVGPATFEITLRQIRSAYAQLQKAGVKSFVFTADHGFLLLDESTQRIPFGTKRTPKPRYVLDEHARAENGMVNVSLSALGYDGLGGYLLLREDTAIFATANAGATFVHGGNSPQERVIPVLTVRRARPSMATHISYVVEALKEKDLMGAHQISLRLRPAMKNTLDFTSPTLVALGIRAVGKPDVRTVIKDFTGPGTLQGGAMRLPMSTEWSKVFFNLEGGATESVQIEIHHPDGVETVASSPLPDWFEVDFRRGLPGQPKEVAKVDDRALTWADALPDEGTRKVFLHLQLHGSVTEAEVVGFLGSPRAFRQFSLKFEEHLAKVPFRVRIEGGVDGKRYVKDGEG